MSHRDESLVGIAVRNDVRKYLRREAIDGLKHTHFVQNPRGSPRGHRLEPLGSKELRRSPVARENRRCVGAAWSWPSKVTVTFNERTWRRGTEPEVSCDTETS